MIIGRSAPQDVVDMAPAGVIFRGWVPELDDVYAHARVAIAPLRYGAGIKGKVGEAMSYGVPVVGTSVAAEGMDIEHLLTGWVSDDAEEFARGIIDLYQNDELWTRVSEAGRAHVERTLGSDVFEYHLKTVLSNVAPEQTPPGSI
jgi:glycosyltransferase involved in cell wall biosynthesis